MRILPAARSRCRAGPAAVLALCLAATPALAEPSEAIDPLLQLLADKGALAAAAPSPPIELARASEPGLLRRMHDRAASLTSAAIELLGVRYRRGGTSAEAGFDCSGFTRHVFESSLGIVLPRRADEQAAASGLVAVGREDLRPGDLVFFNTLKRTFSHVGIYIGSNRFIHSPRPGTSVRTEDMGFAYWAKRFSGARRAETLFALAPAVAPAAVAPAAVAPAAVAAPTPGVAGGAD